MTKMNDASAGFEKIVQLTPAYDQRDPDPRKDYGVHGVDLIMILKGEKGATQFSLSTGWLLPQTVGLPNDGSYEELYKYTELLHSSFTQRYYPMPTDLGYHAKEPQYEDQYVRNDCHILGGECYYDGSGLNAYIPFRELLTKGSDGVWVVLEKYYNFLFEGGEWIE